MHEECRSSFSCFLAYYHYCRGRSYTFPRSFLLLDQLTGLRMRKRNYRVSGRNEIIIERRARLSFGGNRPSGSIVAPFRFSDIGKGARAPTPQCISLKWHNSEESGEKRSALGTVQQPPTTALRGILLRFSTAWTSSFVRAIRSFWSATCDTAKHAKSQRDMQRKYVN